MGRSSFIVKACVEVKCSVFMCFFLMCYWSFSVKVYTLVTMIGMESYFFKTREYKFDRVVQSFFSKFEVLFRLCKKLTTEVYSHQCSSKKKG